MGPGSDCVILGNACLRSFQALCEELCIYSHGVFISKDTRETFSNIKGFRNILLGGSFYSFWALGKENK